MAQLGRGSVWRLALPVVIAAAAAMGQVASAQQGTPAPAAPQEKPRATAFVAASRFGDIFWENDRTVHRIYSHDLEAVEPPSGSGIDAWAKRIRGPFSPRRLAAGGNYHENQGDGMDFYDVGGARGAGGLGIWYDNKLWVSRNYRTHKILQDGPDVAHFEVGYAPWPVDVVRKVWETRRFTLPMGTNFTQMVSTIDSDTHDPLVVGIGISKFSTSHLPGKLTSDRAGGRISVWSEGPPEKGAMGVAIIVDPASLIEVKQDADNYLLLVRVTPGKPFVYYMGATWSKGLDFQTREQWDSYVKAQRPGFDPQANYAVVKP